MPTDGLISGGVGQILHVMQTTDHSSPQRFPPPRIALSRRSMLHGLGLLAMAGTLAGCAGNPSGRERGKSPLSAASIPLEGTDWQVGELQGMSLPQTGPAPLPSLRLDPSSGKATGFSGCNFLNGAYQVEGNTLALGPFAMTRRACPPGLEVLEQTFTRVLSEARRWEIRDGSLILSDGSGEFLARLQPRPA